MKKEASCLFSSLSFFSPPFFFSFSPFSLATVFRPRAGKARVWYNARKGTWLTCELPRKRTIPIRSDSAARFTVFPCVFAHEIGPGLAVCDRVTEPLAPKNFQNERERERDCFCVYKYWNEPNVAWNWTFPVLFSSFKHWNLEILNEILRGENFNA